MGEQGPSRVHRRPADDRPPVSEHRLSDQSVRITKTVTATKLQSGHTSVFGGRDHLCQHADDSMQKRKGLFEQIGFGLFVALDEPP